MYLYAVPHHDNGKCASVGEERKSPVRDESQERPPPAVAVPRQWQHLSKCCPTAPISSSPPTSAPRCAPSRPPPRRTRGVMPSRSETDSSVLAWTGRCSGSSSGAQPKSPLFSGGLWKTQTDRQRSINGWLRVGVSGLSEVRDESPAGLCLSAEEHTQPKRSPVSITGARRDPEQPPAGERGHLQTQGAAADRCDRCPHPPFHGCLAPTFPPPRNPRQPPASSQPRHGTQLTRTSSGQRAAGR